MKFCSDCAAPLIEATPAGDDRPRRVCSNCGQIHYRNPVVVVGCLVERGDEVLLCRRAIEPVKGRWTLPAGYLELGETLIAGARRETKEEAAAEVHVTGPLSYLDLVHIGQMHATFRARLVGNDYGPGPESLEVAFFPAEAIPWQELAFPAVHFALRLWLDDRGGKSLGVHHGSLRWSGHGSRFDAANYTLVDHLRSPLA